MVNFKMRFDKEMNLGYNNHVQIWHIQIQFIQSLCIDVKHKGTV